MKWHSIDAAEIAVAFHDAYERLAPEFNYKTREASAVSWIDVPENNRLLMMATVQSLLDSKIIKPGEKVSDGSLRSLPPVD